MKKSNHFWRGKKYHKPFKKSLNNLKQFINKMPAHISNWNIISKHNALQEKIMCSSLTTTLLGLPYSMFKAINFTKKGFLSHLFG